MLIFEVTEGQIVCKLNCVGTGMRSDILWLFKLYCYLHCTKRLIDTILQFISVNCYINGMHHLQPTPPSSRPIQQPPVTSRPLVEKQLTGELSLWTDLSTKHQLVWQHSPSIVFLTHLSGSFSSCKLGVINFGGSFTSFWFCHFVHERKYLSCMPRLHFCKEQHEWPPACVHYSTTLLRKCAYAGWPLSTMFCCWTAWLYWLTSSCRSNLVFSAVLKAGRFKM